MEENNTNPTVPMNQVDNASWNIPSMAPSFVSMEQPNRMTPEPVMPTVTDRSKENQSFLGSLRYDAVSTVNKIQKNSWIKDLDPTQGKISLTTEVPLMETHTRLSDGETWLPRYKSYLPGVDNETRLSHQQSGGDKFMNIISRFASNTSKGALDIGSFVYGVGAAAMTGRFDALYDNSMSRYVDDMTERTNQNYKNYYDAETRKKGLGFDMQTFDKVMGGAEFTARMLASEALIATATGGASLPSSMARTALKAGIIADKFADTAKIGKNISRMMKIATTPERTVAAAGNMARMSDRVKVALGSAASKGKIADYLVQGRFALTSPMYEAGFESLHFKKEAEKQFYDYYRNQGTEPTPEQVNQFSEKMAGASNAVFVANMGILSVSNLALFGDMLNIKNPLSKSIFSPSKYFKENIYRMGTEKAAGTGLNQAMKATVWNKAAAYLAPITKGMVIEGVYEEGGQGIASGTLKNYVASAYDENAMKNTAGYLDSFGKAFSDQFGTKEGKEEMMIGAIIGGLFGVGSSIKNTPGEYKQQKNIANLQNVGEEFVENFTNDYTNEQLLSLFSGANRFQNLRDKVDQAQTSDNKLDEASAKAQSFISLLDSYHSVGKESEFTEMFASMLQGMDAESIANATGLDLSEIDDFKQEQIQGMNDLADTYSTARKAGRYIFRPNIGGLVEQEINGKKVRINSENLSSAFAFASTMSFFNEKFAIETFDAFQTKLAQMNVSPEIIQKMGALAVLKNAAIGEDFKYPELAQEENKLRLDVGRITRQINTLTQSEEKTGKAEKLLELSNELTQVQTKLSDVTSKKDALWKSAVDNFYAGMKSGSIVHAAQPDLENFTQHVKDIQDSLDGLQIKREDKDVLERLLGQFNTANASYKSFADLSLKLSDPKFAFKTYKGILAGTRAKADKSLNEHTRESLLKIYGYNQEISESIEETYRKNQKNILDEAKLAEDYMPTQEDLLMIKRKINQKRTLTINEQKFQDKHRVLIDEFKTPEEIDPLTSDADSTEISERTIERNSKSRELQDLENGQYSEQLGKKIDSLNQEIQELKDQKAPIQDAQTTDFETEIEALNREIEDLENEIEQLEVSRSEYQDRKQRMVNSAKTEYQQYEYIKPNGDTMVGYLEVNKGILQIVNEDEIVDIQETNLSLRKIKTDSIKGLSKIREEDVLIEGKEIYVNGKIYKLGLKNPSLEKSISKDKEGNYQVTLQARNGRLVTLKGSVADAIVYQHLLNKLEQNATEQEIIRLREQAERDSKIEREYEKLISKTKDRDTRIDEIDYERYQAQTAEENRQKEIDQKIQEKQQEILDRELQELMRLQDEISKLNGEITRLDKIDRLESQIKSLNDSNIEEPTARKSRMILLLERELEDLKKPIQTEFNPNGTPLEQLEWIVSNIPLLQFGNVEQAAGLQAPSQEDVDEYIDLVNNSSKNSQQKKRVAELRDKLLPFNLAESLDLQGVNILDIINLYNQAKNIQEVKEEQIQQFTESDVQKMNQKAQNVKEFRSPSVGLVYDGAYIENDNGLRKIFHIRLMTFLEKALEKGFKPQIIVLGEKGRSNEAPAHIVDVTPENVEYLATQFESEDNIKVNLNDQGLYLKKPKGEVSFNVYGDGILELIDSQAHYIKGQSTGYVAIYETKADGTFGPKQSEFKVSRDGVEIPFDKETLNSLKEGDTVTLEFDRMDDYNQTISQKEYSTKGNIYIKKNGKLVQILKASSSKGKTDASGWAELDALRKKVVKSKTPVSIKIKGSYIGLPLITLNSDLSAREFQVDESKVIAYGYRDENGKLHGDIATLGMDNTQYIDAIESEKKVPVMAFKSNNKIIGFPINLRPQGIDLRQDVDDILTDQTRSREQKMFEINSILEQHNLYTEDLALNGANFDVNKVKEALTQVYDQIDFTNSEEFQNADKYSYINLDDAFGSSKLILNLDIDEKDYISSESAVKESFIQTVSTVNLKGLDNSIENICSRGV